MEKFLERFKLRKFPQAEVDTWGALYLFFKTQLIVKTLPQEKSSPDGSTGKFHPKIKEERLPNSSKIPNLLYKDHYTDADATTRQQYYNNKKYKSVSLTHAAIKIVEKY